MPESSLEFCPVPQEQQPLCEYEELKSSWFFAWAALDLPLYLRRLGGLSFWLALLVMPFVWASFPPRKALLSFCLAEMLGVGALLALILVRLYLGWLYIGDRLKAEKIFYEESGWYDGQTWTKTPAILQRDQLVVTYQVQPILKKLRQTLFCLGSFVLSTSLVWAFLSSF